jgi:hypothetical protein
MHYCISLSVSIQVTTDVLVQQGLTHALEGIKPDKTTDEEWKVMEREAVSTIRLCLSNEVNYLVIKRTLTVEKMEDPRRVVYSEVADKSVGTEASTIQVMYGGSYMIHRPSKYEHVIKLISVDEKVEDENDKVFKKKISFQKG